MGPYSPGPLNLQIGESYVTIFWVRFQILFMKFGLIWASYETHYQSRGMIRLKYKEYNTLGHTSFKSSEVMQCQTS
ncbi:hypothetical protein Gogos_019169, partial [Gossypium gossypioides]|nr:hypothetical protein [Gossypium gossypioides]